MSSAVSSMTILSSYKQTHLSGNDAFWQPKQISVSLRLLFSLKPKEMAKMRLLALWIDQK